MDRKDKLNLLEKSNILEIAANEVHSKHQGDHELIKSLILITNLSNVNNHDGTSSNAWLSSVTGSGKDNVIKSVLQLWPNDKSFHINKATSQTLSYYKANVEDWTWEHKILYFEDPQYKAVNNQTFYGFASNQPDGEFKTLVPDSDKFKGRHVKDLTVKGKPVILVTSASIIPKEDNLRRFNVFNCDSSSEQSNRVMSYIAEVEEGDIKPKYDMLVKTAFRNIKPSTVHIPFAKELTIRLQKEFGNEVPVIIRTKLKFVLDLIRSHAVLYQRQRKKNIYKRIVAIKEDYESIRPLLDHMFRDGIVPITEQERELIKIINNQLPLSSDDNPSGELTEFHSITVAELEPYVSFVAQPKTLRSKCKQLVKKGYLKAENRFNRYNKSEISFSSSKIDSITFPTLTTLSTSTTPTTLTKTNTDSRVKVVEVTKVSKVVKDPNDPKNFEVIE